MQILNKISSEEPTLEI